MDECYSYLLLKNEEPIKSQEEETLKKESKSSVNKKTNDEDF